jgi:hypothetical protein
MIVWAVKLIQKSRKGEESSCFREARAGMKGSRCTDVGHGVGEHRDLIRIGRRRRTFQFGNQKGITNFARNSLAIKHAKG